MKVSYWEGIFSGDMLVFGRVVTHLTFKKKTANQNDLYLWRSTPPKPSFKTRVMAGFQVWITNGIQCSWLQTYRGPSQQQPAYLRTSNICSDHNSGIVAKQYYPPGNWHIPPLEKENHLQTYHSLAYSAKGPWNKSLNLNFFLLNMESPKV